MAHIVNDGDNRCIFCKKDARVNPSLEHIIPESLGNKGIILEPGAVCRECNSYFFNKIEKPLLESDYFTNLRFQQWIPSKRGRIPTMPCHDQDSGIDLTAYRTTSGQQGLVVHPNDASKLFNSWYKRERGMIIFNGSSPPPDTILERFMAKISMELIATRVCHEPGWKSATVFLPDLDPLRLFARFGAGDRWPLHVRRIYDADKMFPTINGVPDQVLHEADVLYSDRSELYVIIAIFGVEIAINMGGRELDGYRDWLARHAHQSPLYFCGGRKNIERPSGY